MVPRSVPTVPITTDHAPSIGPTTRSAAVRTSEKNTSANSAPSAMLRIGRMSTPGWSAGTRINDRPAVLRRVRIGAAQHVQPVGARPEGHPDLLAVQHPLASVAHGRVRTPPRSDPASGSLKPCPHMSSQRMIARQEPRLLLVASRVQQGGTEQVAPVHADPVRRRARKCSSRNTSSSSNVPPRPPYSTGHVMPSQPPSASSRSHARRSSHHESSVGPPTPAGGRELPRQVFGQPFPDLFASCRLGGGVGEVHQVSVRWCGARGFPAYVRSEPGAIS